MNVSSLQGAPLSSHSFRYERSKLRAGIVHLGVGNFHRSHQAWYLHRWLERNPHELQWGICGVGLLPGDRAMRDALASQDHLFTLLEKNPGRRFRAEVVGSMVDYLFAPDDPMRVIEKIADPAKRLITLTITEGGYEPKPESESPSLADYLRGGKTSASPTTAFGYLTAGFALRQARGLGPLTVLSCDNIQGNGELAQRTSLKFAELGGPALAKWMEHNVTFPNSMVDRITPVTSELDRAIVREQFHLDDRWPVPAEPFVQWVIEDRFAAGRPALEEVGAQFVPDVAPYEKMKLRLLNCSHQALGYFGAMLGYRYVHEAAADEDITRLMELYMRLEALPTLDPVPGVDLPQYCRTLIERFRNDSIGDTLTRICADSSNRISKWLVPVIVDQLSRGGPIGRSAAVVASWAHYLHSTDATGARFPISDERKEEFVALADPHLRRLDTFLQHPLLSPLAASERFSKAFIEVREALIRSGPRQTLLRFA